GITYNNVIENQVISDDDWPEITENTFYNHCTFTNTDSGIDNYATIYINNSEAKGESYQYSFQLLNNEPPSKMIINNSKVYQLYNGGDLFIYNSTLNDALTTFGDSVIVIDELTTLGPDFNVIILTWTETRGLIYTNNTQIISKLEELNIPGITIISDDSNDDNIIIENQTITDANTNSKNLTYINCILNSKILNYGSLTLINSTLNSTIENQGTLIIDDNCVLGENLVLENKGEIVCNNSTSLIPYSTIINGNYALENIILNSNKTNNGNLTLINCNITAKITNNGNLTLINCNITAKITNNGNLTLINSSLSNNNLTVSGSEIKGFLIENSGNSTLINCTVENNTFNTSHSGCEVIYGLSNSDYDFIENNLKSMVSGVIYNNGTMNVINSGFLKNKVGFINTTHATGRGAAIYNNALLNIDNSTFIDNWAGIEGGAIYSNAFKKYYTQEQDSPAILNINNSVFENNYAGFYGGAIKCQNFTITNTNFTNNSIDNQVEGWRISGGFLCSGGAIHSTNGNIDNCIFENNSAGITPGKVSYNSFIAGALQTNDANITNSQFINNTAETAAILRIGSGYTTKYSIIDNCLFENNYLEDSETGNIFQNMGYLNISNSEFKNNYDANNLIGLYGEDYTTNVLNTKFTDNKMTNSTISSTQKTGTIKNNTYTNTTINDILTLNTPNKIYTGEPITITGTYTLNNPKYYDTDILEQNKFQVYINDELVETIDELEFTITPTSENMIITVQPTISQTRKSAIIQASTLNFTLEPITATVGETAQLTAHITVTTDGEDMEINTGRVYFKVNGKILRDTSNGRILYADVSDNTATLDYNVPKTWNDETTIEAVFTGNDEIPQKTSNTVNPTITTAETEEPEFTVDYVTTTAGSEVTITVTTKNLDNGKVVLKVNGKTVKADDSKLYAKVTGDTTIFTYTVPKTYKAGDYTIKAVYTSGTTKFEADAKLNVE
ncbi:MAG: hypothetical protein BZ136_09395, partial [Methanosphaera sp. rholeuAM74]